MKGILRVFLLLLFTFSSIFAVEFSQITQIVLKKDELKKILVKYDGKEKLLKFRWTLFKNGGLVVFKSYDRIVSQNNLYMRYKNQSIRQELKTRGADFYNVPYILIRFKDFKYDTNEAVFELLLSDASMSVALKYLK
ncbi:MAG: hypothetical protein COB17_05065 [Sulfurimonas sp.]|nr:MAG: hypothetical protein COB17_05065 [Sulfurimonas sp.]